MTNSPRSSSAGTRRFAGATAIAALAAACGAFALALALALVPTGASAAGTVSEAIVLPGGADPTGSFHARRMEIGAALRLLLEERGMSVVLDPAVRDTVDLTIESATVGEILELLRRSHGLSYEFRGSVLLVGRSETRRFQLDLVDDEPNVLQPSSMSGGVGGLGSLGGDGGATASGGDASQGRSDWNEIRESLEKIASPDGKLTIHERSGTIVARDDPRVLDLMEEYLDGIRAQLGRQVSIEARIVEVRLGDGLEAGVDWTVFEDAFSGDLHGALSRGGVASQGAGVDDAIFHFGVLDPGKVEAILSALEQQSRLRVVARPRIVTSGNRPARFEVTERVPYIVKSVSREGGVAFTDYEIEFEEAGVELQVVAQPSASGSVAMRIRPSVSSVTGYTPSLPDLGPQPIVDLRSTTTTLAARDGETVVLSGLIQERRIEQRRGVPILSRIPLLGWIFRHTERTTQRVELVVLLTPTILQAGRSSEILQQDRLRFLEHGLDLGAPDLGRAPDGRDEQAVRLSLAAERTEQAFAARAAGRMEEAATLGGEALDLLPGDPAARTNQGLLLRDAGRTAEAEELFRAVLEQEGVAPAVASAARNDLAVLLLGEGRCEEALDLLDRQDGEAAEANRLAALARCAARAGR